MSEFNNRISAQRDALKIVNGSSLFIEPLMSLTEKAIERWSRNNKVNAHDSIIILLKSMSGTLFFLANKSQEQVTEDYKVLSDNVSALLSILELEVANKALQQTNNLTWS
jgi:hypothetical protein